MATIKIKQIGSPIRRPASQRQILIGLGLNKMHKVVERQDTPEVRGAIAKIPHLVQVIDQDIVAGRSSSSPAIPVKAGIQEGQRVLPAAELTSYLASALLALGSS